MAQTLLGVTERPPISTLCSAYRESSNIIKAKLKRLEEGQPNTVNTLREIIGVPHKLDTELGTTFPIPTSSHINNWFPRKVDLSRYSRDLLNHDPRLNGMIAKEGGVNQQLLRQSIHASTLYGSGPLGDNPLSNEPDKCNLNPYTGKGRFNLKQINNLRTQILTSINNATGTQNNLEDLMGITETDMAYRFAVYTSEGIGLGSDDRNVKIATIAVFEQIGTDAWRKINRSIDIDDDMKLAFHTLQLIRKGLSIQNLGRHDRDPLVQSYAEAIFDTTDTLGYEAINIMKAIQSSEKAEEQTSLTSSPTNDRETFLTSLSAA